MSLSSDDGDQGYPGNLQVEAAFDFDEDNALEITYIARTDRTTPVNMACNLLLNLGGEGSGSVLDHELRLDASTVLEADDRLIPTGNCSVLPVRPPISVHCAAWVRASIPISTGSGCCGGTTTSSPWTVGGRIS